MENLREYLLSITSAALICSILLSILQDTKYHTILKVLCGIFMSLSILRPWLHLRLNTVNFEDLFASDQADSIIEEGSNAAKQAMQQIVAEQTAARINQIAKSYEADISVIVTVADDPPIPMAVEISGAVSPLTKYRLSAWIAEELGIGKEAQKWGS